MLPAAGQPWWSASVTTCCPYFLRGGLSDQGRPATRGVPRFASCRPRRRRFVQPWQACKRGARGRIGCAVLLRARTVENPEPLLAADAGRIAPDELEDQGLTRVIMRMAEAAAAVDLMRVATVRWLSLEALRRARSETAREAGPAPRSFSRRSRRHAALDGVGDHSHCPALLSHILAGRPSSVRCCGRC